MKQIIISGWYGVNNTGDEAILLSLMDGFQEILGEIRFVILTEMPGPILEQYSKQYHVQSFKHLSLESKEGLIEYILKGKLLHLLKMIYESDLFVLGGGGLLRDNTRPRNLRKLLDEILFAKLVGTKTAYGLLGVGPIVSSKGGWVIKKITELVSEVTVRDFESKKILTEKLRCKKKVFVGADPAFLLKKQPCKHIKLVNFILNAKKRSRSLIAVCLCDYGLRMDLRKIHRKNICFPHVMVELSKVISFLIEDLQADIIFFPFLIANGDDDREPAKNVMKRIKKKYYEHILMVEEVLPPREAKWVLSEMKYVVGTRLHSLIFSASEGTPMVGINYEPKVKHFMEDMNFSKFCFDFEEISLEAFSKKFLLLEQNYDKYKKELFEKSLEKKKRALTGIKEMANNIL